ncbi:AGAP009762-PA [Anopheles gambiae str. PEST]|uniref:AGAP009762-PA n=1 Tax=Anopheles gambiae TaxID=7165 RepID=Q7PM27_ANOGA|nr:AGAP009762-PA [Anopheles gambiae str. PEST]
MERLKWCILVGLAFVCQFGLAPGQEGVKTAWRKGGGVQVASHDVTIANQSFVEMAEPGRQTNTTVMSLQRSNESMSALDRFMNKTKGHIPAGVCFEEVPTVSLLKYNPRGDVPAGNGSNPSLSRIQVCCPGYERNVHNFRKCEPVCEDPCLNGLCVGPNTCECYPDFVRNGQGRCVPTCPIGCDHGECVVGTGECRCKEGYELDPTTKKFCVPHCTGGCGVGRCVDVERCECGEGYKFDPKLKCAPHCEGGCFNGHCVEPGVCRCEAGYEMSEMGCEPICSNGCFHGVCTAPETCSCKPGYQKVGDQCTATCDRPCLNGECTGPNVCSCNRGYILDEANPFHCIAHCPNGCPNGVCSGPNMCLCNAGYRVTVIDQPCCKGYKRVKLRCVPICSLPCENSKCTAPDVCTCNPGYERLSNHRCIPHCDDCDNGICTKPGYCQCHTGYTRSDNGTCVPECNNCVNGFCSLPDACQCYEGYQLQERDDASRYCQPVCEGGCLHGQCVAPDECLCGDGYTLSPFGECVRPTTPPPRCPEGYVDDGIGCSPICSEPCRNGTCVGPDECECFPGHSSENSTSPFVCQPVCNGSCANGDCIAPGVCICHAQYGKIGDECIPLCDRCSLGHCVQPNVCVCDRGYRLIDGDCEPICETECINAICTGPNACTCLPGYNYTDINALFDCLPVCDEECINGRCVAPQRCECNEGYIRDEENACIHPDDLCRMKCTNGQCHGAECVCDAGYIKHPTDGHCEKTCPNGCTNGDCNGGECFCHEGFRLSLDNVSVCEPICGEDYDYSSAGCINGRCIRPNVCQCDEGYEFVDANQTRCESVEEIARQRLAQERMAECRRSCRNGKCRAGECRCNEGYAQPEGNTLSCKAVCVEPCRNGTCVRPDQCECKPGFVFVEGSASHCRSEDDLAREAYERCTERCRNGVCHGDQCFCMLGYTPSDLDPYDCQPVCERPCVNGTCAGNDRCHCWDGYGKTGEDDHACEPICTSECVNADCVAPDQCACRAGYIPLGEGSSTCVKEETPEERSARLRQVACERECTNGWCEQGECRCVEGFYHENGNTLHCEPYCAQSCEMGRCIGNDTCECLARHELVEQYVCGPVCSEECVRGYCAAPDVCRCHDGYAMVNGSSNACEPVCGEDGCINGVCVGPNECICLDGYYPDQDDPLLCHREISVIQQLHEPSSGGEYYKMSYIHYFIPVIASVALIVAVLIVKMIVRNRQKDYHVGKLGNAERAGRKSGLANRRKGQSNRTTDYNDYNLVVLFPTESKENCVYFMPKPDSKTNELTKLNLEIETI